MATPTSMDIASTKNTAGNNMSTNYVKTLLVIFQGVIKDTPQSANSTAITKLKS